MITGATGLLGAALVLQLAARTSADDLICLVRPADSDPQKRLTAALSEAAKAYRTDALTTQRALRKAKAVSADLTLPGLGLDSIQVASPYPTWFWHVGALIGFGHANRRRLFATNTAGTRRIVDLATQMKAEALHYVSTAYVAGSRTGEIPEQPITDAVPREFYEASKIAAERIVWNAPLPTRIYRPTAIIGHHATYACGGPYTGVYGLMRRIALHQSLRHRLDGGRHPIRLLARGDLPLNLVPVDHVARELVEIAHASTPHRVFHLSNPTPPTVGATLRAIFTQLGIAAWELVDDPALLHPADLHLAELFREFYADYLNHEHRFRRDHAHAALLQPARTQYPMDDDLLNQFFAHYHRHELARRHPVPATRKPA
ncbi:Male sterility domain-containing protein (plasmid) [Streptomyces violaceusniger Tu 4113]|uniref:Male sterility domain-containing protein n=1 Tax=Streptomyces violaceusniger (strain Tu 4113) TaxID=653045 RepID=G2PHK0_STRV4|nr:Male sterility domain-containing protein [Streptomyces violaceusniger Tu 4113]